MYKNEKLSEAIYALYIIGMDGRTGLKYAVEIDAVVSPDDPWVAAALGCVNDADIPDVAMEFFIADVKEGLYDLPNPEPLAAS